MADTKVQKIKLLKIWEILNWKSDEQHPLSTQDIIMEHFCPCSSSFEVCVSDDVSLADDAVSEAVFLGIV